MMSELPLSFIGKNPFRLSTKLLITELVHPEIRKFHYFRKGIRRTTATIGTSSKLMRQPRGGNQQANVHSINSDLCQGLSEFTWP